MQLSSGRLIRYCGLSIVFGCIFTATFMWYFCTNTTCSLSTFPFLYSKDSLLRPHWHKLKANRQILSNWSSEKILSKDEKSSLDHNKIVVAKSDFNIKGSDVIVFLHIQNTGGSVFARHMV
ncbi:Heparan-sulfate 6-O-sulfotransferase 3, partial [Stegodyphus mimosarum]